MTQERAGSCELPQQLWNVVLSFNRASVVFANAAFKGILLFCWFSSPLTLEFAAATLPAQSLGSCDELKSFCNKTSDTVGIGWLLADKLDEKTDAGRGAGWAAWGGTGAAACCMDAADAG